MFCSFCYLSELSCFFLFTSIYSNGQLVTQQALSQRQRYHHNFSSWLEMGDDMKDISPKNDTDSKLNFQKPSGLTLSLIALHPRLKAIWKTKVSNSLSQCVICRVHEYGVKVGWELFPKVLQKHYSSYSDLLLRWVIWKNCLLHKLVHI